MKEYRIAETFQAKIFEEGDQDGFVHAGGSLGAMEDARYGLKPDLVPFVRTLRSRFDKGEFGKHYLLINSNGEKCSLIAKEIFNEKYEPVLIP
jgi:hypothetical protein